MFFFSVCPYFLFFFFSAKAFFIPKISLTKCKCGKVMGFKVDEALAFIGEKGKEQALKRFISKTGEHAWDD